MSAEMAQKLVQGGIKAVRNGDHDLARKAFTQALKLDPNNEAAWLGMATITESDTDKQRILQKVLEINPDNTRAQEALRRLVGEPEIEPEPDLSEDEPTLPDEVAYQTAELDELDDQPSDPEPEVLASSEIEPITGIEPGDTGDLSDFPIPDWSLDEDIPGVDSEETTAQSEPPPPIIQTLEVRNSDGVFASMPSMSARGQGGIPVPEHEALETASQEVSDDVQQYLEEALADYLTPEVDWKVKQSGRAGSTEYRTFLLQAWSAGITALLIVTIGLGTLLVTNATARRLLFAPTTIPSATPTNTPTATPGLTNTPSATPRIPASSTPTLPFEATLGFLDPNFPPTPTEVYFPQSVTADNLLDDAVLLMEQGELEEARELIDQVLVIESDTGEFPATDLLSQWYLLNDDPQQAREVLNEWEERWQEQDSSLFDNSESLLLIAQARVDIYEARNGLGDRFLLLDTALDRLESSLGYEDSRFQAAAPDRVNSEGYLLLAEQYALRGNSEVAIETLDRGLQATFNQLNRLNDTQLRMAKVRIFVDERQYAEAFQELYNVLQFDPFLEEALILQVELALDTNQAGLGVLYAQQYLLYYPGSLRGLYLLGQAREAENKFDLALNAYSRAVAGDVTDEEYTSDPFFLQNLLARANLLIRQGRQDEAAEDFELALDIGGDNPELRLQSLQASFAGEDYSAVLSDAEELIGDNSVSQAEVRYYQGLSYLALAEDGASAGSYADAVESLDAALSLNLPFNLRANAQESLARAALETRDFDVALTAINQALEDGVTGSRIFLRGQILDAQGETELALLDYEFIVTWGQYYNLPFYDEAVDLYNSAVSRTNSR